MKPRFEHLGDLRSVSLGEHHRDCREDVSGQSVVSAGRVVSPTKMMSSTCANRSAPSSGDSRPLPRMPITALLTAGRGAFLCREDAVHQDVAGGGALA